MIRTGLGAMGAVGLPSVVQADTTADTEAMRGSGKSPLAQDYTIIYHNLDKEYYVEGCGLTRLSDGTLLAIVPVVPRSQWAVERRATQSVTHIVRSEDHGQTWQEVSHLPYYTARPWLHGNKLYLLASKGGTKFRNDDLLIVESRDGGQTWSEPITLFRGHYWNCHTSMVAHRNQVYWAIDEFTENERRPRVIAGDLSKELMNPTAWRMSNAAPLPNLPDLLQDEPIRKKSYLNCLEPNVINVQGQLRVVMVVKNASQSTANLCALLDVEDDGRNLTLKFSQYSPMPGGQLKFCIVWDDGSQLFWATANLVVDSHRVMPWWSKHREQLRGAGGNDRRFLMLQYGLDGVNWFQAGCVARAGKVSQSFMYGTPIIDGDDLAIISRTSLDAPDQHDADHATFHRVRKFRSLAMDLYPDGERPSDA